MGRGVGRVVGAVVGALALAGCQSAAEEAVEQAIEAGGGGDVELDLDDEGEGSITIQRSDGEQTIEVGGDLPSELTVSLPDGYVVTASSSLQQGDETFISASLRYEGADFDAIVAHFDDELAGVADLNRSENDLEGDRSVFWIRAEPALQVQVINIDGDAGVDVSVVEATSG